MKKIEFIPNANCYVHRPIFKVICNTVLRAVQFYTRSPYVIVSVFEIGESERKFIKYKIAKIEHKHSSYFRRVFYFLFKDEWC